MHDLCIEEIKFINFHQSHNPTKGRFTRAVKLFMWPKEDKNSLVSLVHSRTFKKLNQSYSRILPLFKPNVNLPLLCPCYFILYLILNLRANQEKLTNQKEGEISNVIGQK